MAYRDFVSTIHRRTKRNYVERVLEHDKAACAEVAGQFGYDYWDGDRRYGFGGYTYDGRWRPVAEELAAAYGIEPGTRVLDVGCGKGFLLYELTEVCPGVEIRGVDISDYAIRNAKPEVRDRVEVGDVAALPFPDGAFDLVLSINTLHNLPIDRLALALSEIQRVGRERRYVVVESFRNEREKANLLYWQLTCRAFFSTSEWEWLFERFGYTGDHSFIFFE